MKNTNKRVIPFFLLLVLLLSFLSAAPVYADGGEETSPWAGVFDDQGHLLPGVVDMGQVEVEARWMEVGIPGILEINPTFHQYLSTRGDLLLVPSASTLFFMGLSPVESGLMNAYDSLQNGQGIAITGADLLLHLMNQTVSGKALLSEIGEFGYSDPGLFADDLIHNKGKIWSVAGTDMLNITMELMITSFSDQMLATTYLLYLGEDCSASPTGCPEDLCALVPQACADKPQEKPVSFDPACPEATLTVGVPQLSIAAVAPAYPLAYLQDPERRGVDLAIRVLIPPTVQVIYTPIPRYAEQTRCMRAGSSATGKPNCRTDPSLSILDGFWITTNELVGVDCVRTLKIFPEAVKSLSASSNLTSASRQWIETDLAAYYPGAKVLQGFLSLLPGISPVAATCAADGTCQAWADLLRVPFLDPGVHALDLTVETAGTPITRARIVRQTGSLEVGLVSARLIAVGSQ
jgi:hypothetical protein